MSDESFNEFKQWYNTTFSDKLSNNMNYQRLYYLLAHNSESNLAKKIMSRVMSYSKIKELKVNKMFNRNLEWREFNEND